MVVGGKLIRALLDSGASDSFVSWDVVLVFGIAAIPVVAAVDCACGEWRGVGSNTLCTVVGEVGTYAGEGVVKGD